jgi:hypothetical protein
MATDHGEFMRGMSEYQEHYERGFQDGADGTDYDPPFGAPATLAGYRDGYTDGQKASETLDHIPTREPE